MQEVHLPHICLRRSRAAPTNKGQYRAGRWPVGLLDICSGEAKLLGTRCTGTAQEAWGDLSWGALSAARAAGQHGSKKMHGHMCWTTHRRQALHVARTVDPANTP